MSNPKITDKPGKSKPKAKLLSDEARRKMTRHIIETGQQSEFDYPPDTGTKLADAPWPMPPQPAQPQKKRRRK